VDPAEVGQTVLHDLNITWVVLDRYKMPGGLERTYTTDLAEAIFANQAPIYEDDRITVYQTPPVEDPHAYPLLGPTGWGPLRQDESGAPGRRIGREAASIFLHHTPIEATIAIHYSTSEDETPLYLRLSPDSQPVVTLPPAPNGRIYESTLNELSIIAQPSTPLLTVDEIVLNSDKVDGVVIHSIEIKRP
jgi:hypothetical protein